MLVFAQLNVEKKIVKKWTNTFKRVVIIAALPCCALLFGLWGLEAQGEKHIKISGRAAWLSEYFDMVQFAQTGDNSSIINLKRRERPLRSAGVDMLLRFNSDMLSDETGYYQVVQQPVYTPQNALFGNASGFFQGRGGLVLKPDWNTFLGYGITDHDFSINFWFYPFLGEDGEVLFEWEGLLNLNNEIIPQRISAVFRTNRIVWQFRNVFLVPGQKNSLYEVSSDPYIPEQWYHHQIIYDEKNASIEIFSDKSSKGITYTTLSGEARGTRATLMINNPQLTEFSIGTKYFGMIDDWEISRVRERTDFFKPVEYYYSSGSVYSRIIDLGEQSSLINSVRVRGQEPSNSKFLLYYSVSDDKNDFRKDPTTLDWKHLKNVDGVFENPLKQEMLGQYAQFKIELFADSKAQVSPTIQGFDVSYYVHRLPAPPSNIVVDENNPDGTSIQWQPSVNNQVMGYKVFVGQYSGQYLEQGYPVDVADSTSYLFADLKEKKQYFVVIASYDRFGRTGPFSKEYSIRHIPE